MAIEARWEKAIDRPGSRRDPRRTLNLEAQGTAASGAATSVTVHNISATGMLIESQLVLAIGESIEINLPHAGATPAEVVWLSAKLYGCQFKSTISDAALSAAQLQSAVEQRLEIPPRLEDIVDESFGARLQRLRNERGLTQAQIAQQLGVSKPTVWAWEQDKARPVQTRVNALAEALGVRTWELMAGSGNSALRELLTDTREQIAKAVGVDVQKIRVMIDL